MLHFNYDWYFKFFAFNRVSYSIISYLIRVVSYLCHVYYLVFIYYVLFLLYCYFHFYFWLGSGPITYFGPIPSMPQGPTCFLTLGPVAKPKPSPTHRPDLAQQSKPKPDCTRPSSCAQAYGFYSLMQASLLASPSDRSL